MSLLTLSSDTSSLGGRAGSLLGSEREGLGWGEGKGEEVGVREGGGAQCEGMHVWWL